MFDFGQSSESFLAIDRIGTLVLGPTLEKAENDRFLGSCRRYFGIVDYLDSSGLLIDFTCVLSSIGGVDSSVISLVSP